MGRNPYLRTPPGLSPLSQELIVESGGTNLSYPPRPRSVSTPPPLRKASKSKLNCPSPSYEWQPPLPPKDPYEDLSHVPLLPSTAASHSGGPSPNSRSSSKAHLRPPPIPTTPYIDPHAIAYTGTDSPGTSPSPSPKFKETIGRPTSSNAYAIIFDNDSPSIYNYAYDPPLPKPKRPRSDNAQCSLETLSPSGSPTNTTGFLRGSPKFARSRPFSRFSTSAQKEHPFAKGFEVPQWSKFWWHTAFCGLAYPVLLAFVAMAQDKSLFWARLFTGGGCGLLGLVLGISLLKLARGILEAATWATVIHQSRVPEGAGVRLKDLAAQSDDHTSAMTALKLIWDRHSYHGASQEYRKFYDARPWSLWILLFLVNVLCSGVLPFVLARCVDIEVHIMHQHKKYREVAIRGDLSEEDIKRASDLQPVFENFALTWTLAPFSTHGGLPPVISFTFGNDTIYLSEVILSQFLPNGSGFGTFETDTTLPTIDWTPRTSQRSDPGMATDSGGAHERHEEQEHADWAEHVENPADELHPGSLLKFPRWGIRIRCAKIPDQQVNIIPLSENNLTYVFTPRDTILPLFVGFSMGLPEVFRQPFNFSAAMHENDTLPSGLDPNNIALGAMFSDNGVAHSMKSTPLSLGKEGTGFVTIENIMVRLNTTYAPEGKFGTLGPYPLPDKDGNITFIGYDAAVCLELYEPWVLEVYNSSVGAPKTVRLVEPAASLRDWQNEEMEGEKITDPLVSRALNSTDMLPVYVAGHQNSVNQIVKDNGRDSDYVPSPTACFSLSAEKIYADCQKLISFTGGQDPYSYTELSVAYYAKARAFADAGNVLPYFVGSGLSVARQYHDRQSTTAVINKLCTLLAFLFVFLLGAVSAFFVPRLPLDTPRRGFDLYSWMTAFQSRELVSERASVFGKSMDLRDIKEHAGEIRFRYAV